MSELQTGRREVNSMDDDGAKFLQRLTGINIEDYAYKIAKYCETQKNCEECQFYNGTCRLNNRPYSWDMKPL